MLPVRSIALAACGLALIASVAAAQARPTPPGPATLSEDVERITRDVNAAVVEIFATAYRAGSGLVPAPGDLVTTQRASGSGVIVDTTGYIVTNAHVVRGAQRITVELPSTSASSSILAARGRSVVASLVGFDVETDLAVLKVDERNLRALTFGDSEDLKAGQLVLAFGSPLGLNNSVTLGIVSAVARQLEPESPMIYVQTDASINPGNSGGPLVDLQGRLVGINTLLLSRSGGNDGVGFAVPSNIVRTVYEQIKKSGRVRRGDIGVRAQTLTPLLAAGLGLPRDRGVVLADVLPNTPAFRAGLKPGDIVLSVDGKPMENGRQFQVTLYRRFVGDIVRLEILRDGRVTTEPVAMTERDDLLGLSGTADPRQHLVPRLGVLGVDLDPRMAQAMPGLRTRSGVLIVSTAANAIDARDGGLAPGDIIYAVNRTPVATLAALRAAIDSLKSGDAVVLQLERRGELKLLAFTVE
ncbi:MAG TPA: trypsin-like peptidase domain-containing protein [Vicinamibacterales bacterium]|nr:trypsin-like peptidase domain-containing protein [Vicinamibacterales bacterium]